MSINDYTYQELGISEEYYNELKDYSDKFAEAKAKEFDLFKRSAKEKRKPDPMEIAEIYGWDKEKFASYYHTKNVMRAAVSNFYDMQKTRISMGNRIVQMLNRQFGQKPSLSQEDSMDEETNKFLEEIRKEGKLISEEYTKEFMKSHEKNGDTITWKPDSRFGKWINANKDELGINYIRSASDYKLIEIYESSYNNEISMQEIIQNELKGIPIYEEFLKDEKGVGPLMAAVIIAYFDIYKAKYVSSFIAYAGLDAVYNKEKGKYTANGKWNKQEQYYVTREGNIDTKLGITYNAFLKTKLLGILGGSFLKSMSRWSVCFYEYRNRKLNDPRYKDTSEGQIKFMANRYMIRMFLKELFIKWKEIEGIYYPPKSYEEVFLDRQPHHWQPYANYMAENVDSWPASWVKNPEKALLYLDENGVKYDRVEILDRLEKSIQNKINNPRPKPPKKAKKPKKVAAAAE